MEDVNLEAKKKEKYSTGVTIALLLAVASIGEYGIAVTGDNLVKVGADMGFVLILIGVFKAFLVVRDYMHVGRLFSKGDEH